MAGPVSTRRTSTYRPRNSTTERTLDVLDMFGDNTTTVTAAEVAQRLNVARSTAYRYIQSLVSLGFLEDDKDGGFRIGRRVLELARTARRGFGISEIARPVMRHLALQTNEVVLLTRLGDGVVVCLEREEVATRAVRISYEPGEIFPINAGAAAHVLLAWLDEGELDSILECSSFRRFTPVTLTTARALRNRLTETRAQGFAISRGELDEDVLGVAAPVLAGSGKVVAAISVAALSNRIPDAQIPTIADAVRSAADEISAVLRRGE
jgi:DNA-binding IclR family transcriptional regulator